MDRVVVGITGASGIPYGVRLLEILKEFDVEVHLNLTWYEHGGLACIVRSWH